MKSTILHKPALVFAYPVVAEVERLAEAEPPVGDSILRQKVEGERRLQPLVERPLLLVAAAVQDDPNSSACWSS